MPDALDDEIAAVLGAGTLGAEIAASGPGRSTIRVYVPPEADAQALGSRAERVLLAHGLSPAEAELSIDSVADEPWVERWQSSLSPIPLGRRFVVVANPERADAMHGREPIHLAPGMAFGTGEHETTRLCAAALEEHVRPGSRWLDLGTGTGILAIVAGRCGAARVLAIDHDPQCVSVATEVTARNGAAGAVQVKAGSIGDVRETFDGIVANIQSSFFLAEAGKLASALDPGGVLIASGLLLDDEDEIVAALSAAGLRVDARSCDGAWSCLRARRDG